LIGTGLLPSEIEIVNDYSLAVDLGTAINGIPYEESMAPKKGSVSYSPNIIRLKTKDQEVVEIPNAPLPPPAPLKRHGEAKLAQVLYSLFDFNKGKLVTIRDPKLDNEFYGSPQTAYNPLGVNVLRAAVQETINVYTPYTKVFNEEETITGYRAMDFWYTFVAQLSDTDLYALHYFMISSLLKAVKYQNDAKIGLERPFSLKIQKQPTGVAEVLIPANTFVRKSDKEFESDGKAAILWANPVDPRLLLVSHQDHIGLLANYKSSIAVRGGNSRGAGLIAAFADYCPRQSESLRRINWFAMAIANCKRGPIDICVNSGDLNLFKALLSIKRGVHDHNYDDIKLIIPLSATKGQVREPYFSVQPRTNATYIEIASWFSLPDVNPGIKKQKDSEEAVQKALDSFNQYIGSLPKSYIVQIPVFHSRCFDTTNIFQHGRGHDLLATVASTGTLVNFDDRSAPRLRLSPSSKDEASIAPTTWMDYKAKCLAGIRYIVGWHLCALPIYNPLGTWFTPPIDSLEIVDGEWRFTECSLDISPPVPDAGYDDTDIPEIDETKKGGAQRTPTTTMDLKGPMTTKNENSSVQVPKQEFADEDIPDGGDDDGTKDDAREMF